jgi:hypothetical protein
MAVRNSKVHTHSVARTLLPLPLSPLSPLSRSLLLLLQLLLLLSLPAANAADYDSSAATKHHHHHRHHNRITISLPSPQQPAIAGNPYRIFNLTDHRHQYK